MDMVEKVAKAIAAGLGDNLVLAFLSKSSWAHAQGKAVDGSFRDVNAPLRSDYIEAARAAIAAMREPTDEMLDAGSAAHPAGGYRRETLLNDIIECEWRAMVDAALGMK